MTIIWASRPLYSRILAKVTRKEVERQIWPFVSSHLPSYFTYFQYNLASLSQDCISAPAMNFRSSAWQRRMAVAQWSVDILFSHHCLFELFAPEILRSQFHMLQFVVLVFTGRVPLKYLGRDTDSQIFREQEVTDTRDTQANTLKLWVENGKLETCESLGLGLVKKYDWYNQKEGFFREPWCIFKMLVFAISQQKRSLELRHV